MTPLSHARSNIALNWVYLVGKLGCMARLLRFLFRSWRLARTIVKTLLLLKEGR